MTTSTEPTSETQEIEIKEFQALLIEHLGGATHEEISRAFHDLLGAVTAHGKKGQLLIRVEVEPSSATDGSPLGISFETTVKAPRPTPPKAIFFVDDDGNAVRHDPRQLVFDELREAPARPTTFRSAH